MNKKMMLSALGIVAVSSSIAIADTTPGSGVLNSIHDMNHYTGVTPDSQGRVCAFCHTPHHALTSDTAGDYMPLWSHTLTTSSYVPYASATIDATITAGTMMEGPSKLCMSCHDGAIAVDTHYSVTGTVVLNDKDDWGQAGIAQTSSLSNDHPIGFVFDATDGGVAAGPTTGNPSSVAPSEIGQDKWIRNKEATYLGNIALKIRDRLYVGSEGKPIMTCATCHDVHNKKNVDGTGVGIVNYLLLSPNTDSQICLTCHIK